MNKKELSKVVKVGAFISVKWNDQPEPSIEVVIEQPDWRQKGDVDITTFDGKRINRAVHEQILRASCSLEEIKSAAVQWDLEAGQV
jgi:hypothetical protein